MMPIGVIPPLLHLRLVFRVSPDVDAKCQAMVLILSGRALD